MIRFRRFIPSPAMAVALLALFVAVGGSAYALVVTSGTIKNNTIRTSDVRNRSLLGKDIRRNGIGGSAIKESTLARVPSAAVAKGAELFATVNEDGSLLGRGGGVRSSSRRFEGHYEVLFDRDTFGCGYYATIGRVTGGPPNGEIAISVANPILSGGPNFAGVWVYTYDSAGNPADRRFHVLVNCPAVTPPG